MITNSLDSYNYGISNSSNYKLDPDNPEQAVLYFQQSFTSIFQNFLSQDKNSDSSVDSFNNSFGSSGSTYDPFSSSYDYYSQLIALQTQQTGATSSSSSSSLELLNSSVNLIDKEASYFYQGQRLTGIIQSVVNDKGAIFFRIDGELVPFNQLVEVRKGGIDA